MRAWQAFLIGTLLLAASAARAETIDIYDDHGGLLRAYKAEWAQIAPRQPNVRIVGPCISACTVLLGYVPRKNICVTPRASLGFHLATMQFATQELWQAYPPDIRAWISRNGGLTYRLMWLQAPYIYRYFRKCGASA
jgi:hypothetical protein